MRLNLSLLGLLALTMVLSAPAAAVGQTRAGASAAQSNDFSAQTNRRPRITVYPRRRTQEAKRHCRSWLEQEYRASGTVIVPRMRCWWE